MTIQEQEIYNNIINADDTEKTIEYFQGPFNYDLPLKTTITSIIVGYKYVQTINYVAEYRETELIGYPARNGTEEIIKL